MINKIKATNICCLDSDFFIKCPFLAISVRGANQHLKTIKGEAIESEAKTRDSLCQVDNQWFFIKKIDNSESIILWHIKAGHIFWVFAMKTVIINPTEKEVRVIINK